MEEYARGAYNLGRFPPVRLKGFDKGGIRLLPLPEPGSNPFAQDEDVNTFALPRPSRDRPATSEDLVVGMSSHH